MKAEISLFSQKKFIDASKKFVCVRLGTLESKEHQDMVRSLLKGSFQNTAFVIYAPNGKTKLSQSGRTPQQALGSPVETKMLNIAKKYKAKGSASATVLQDFHSFKQSLNVASADQRLLVFTVANKKSARSAVENQLRIVFNDKTVSGRFHFDRAGSKDKDWAKSIKNRKLKEGTFIIQAGEFGTTGTILKQLPLQTSSEGIKKALLDCNAKFSKTEKRKDYGDHVKKGRREGVEFINEMPPGEDRDGDGKIDHRRTKKRRK